MRWRSTGARYSPAAPWTCSLTATGRPAAFLHHAQGHPLGGRGDRLEQPGRSRPACSTSDTGITCPSHRWKQAAGWAVYSTRISFFETCGQLVVVTFRPAVVGVDRARQGRDHLAQVELDLRQKAILVEVGLEGQIFRQAQQRLAAGLPAQGCLRPRVLAPLTPETTSAPATGSKRSPMMAFSGCGLRQANSQLVHSAQSLRSARVWLRPQYSRSCS